MTFRLSIFSVVVTAWIFGLAHSANGQDATSNSAGQSGSESSAAANSDVRLSIQSDTRDGVLTYVPERWGELYLELQNSGQQPQQLLCSSYVGTKANLQFARDLWVPARARLSVSNPILFPKSADIQNGVAEIHSLLIQRAPGNEVLLKDDSGQLRHDRSLIVSGVDRHTAIIAPWSPAESVPQDVLDLVIAGRVSQGLNNQVTILSGQFLPSDETSLRYLDHLVVTENRLAEDEAALSAVRKWLHSGGRLWVMLDRVDSVVLERLLGDQFQGYVMDRVGLSTVQVDLAPTLAAPAGSPGEIVEFEEPVAMARSVFTGMSVWNSVDGWPAAMTASYGEGQILVTTVGPRAWVKPGIKPDPTKPDPRPPLMISHFVPSPPMEDIAAFAFAKRPGDPLSQQDLEPVAEEFVAYQIPDWKLILGTMAGFVLLLVMIAAFMWRTNRLEHFGWSGSLIAVVFGVIFTAIGVSNRYSVEETISSVQLVQAIPGADDVRTKGVVGVYRQEGNTAPIQAKSGGRIWPESAGSDATLCRLVTTDLDAFHWEGIPQQAGMQMYPVASSKSVPARIAARASLNATGITGAVQGQSVLDGDAVLATQYGRIGVNLNPANAFTAEGKDVLEPDQYLTATFLGDVQNRRQRILKTLFENPAWKKSLNQPQLLLWSKGWNNGFEFGDGLTPQGETLLTVPVEFTKPEAGTEVLVPAPLISYETTRPPDGSQPAGCWDDSKGEWQERSGVCVTWLSFQLPREVLPLKATKASVKVKVDGAMGQIGLLGVKNGTEFPLQTMQDPVGSFSFEITDPEVLDISLDGRITLGVNSGVPSASGQEIPIGGASSSGYWKIESLTLQIWATATELNIEN